MKTGSNVLGAVEQWTNRYMARMHLRCYKDNKTLQKAYLSIKVHLTRSPYPHRGSLEYVPPGDRISFDMRKAIFEAPMPRAFCSPLSPNMYRIVLTKLGWVIRAFIRINTGQAVTQHSPVSESDVG